MPILLVMYKEDNIQKGQFKRFVVSNFYIDEIPEDNYASDYSDKLTLPNGFVNKNRKCSQDFEIISENLNISETVNLPLIQQFLKKIRNAISSNDFL